ncbi:MAG: translation factor GTPase family protein [Actinomycetota bacterium]
MTTLNLGILAHVDAGKTTLTERLLYAAGVIDEIGSVDDGSTQTDSLELERQRGITIKSAVVSFVIEDVTVNLIDTPGHPDFIAEVERVLHVLDGAVMVISAVEGVQAQTVVLMRSLQRLHIPTLMFVNKIDRRGAQYGSALEGIAERLTPAIVPMGSTSEIGTREARFTPNGAADDQLAARSKQASAHPVFFGSAITGAGVASLMGGIRSLLPAADGDVASPVSGTVFKVERGRAGEKIAYVRLFSGAVRTRDRLPVGDREGKVTAIAVFEGGAVVRAASVTAGHIGKLWGLADVQIGDAIGVSPPTSVPHRFAPPTLETVIVPRHRGDKQALHAALAQLAEQDPLINLRQDDARQEMALSLYGEVQKEVVEATLAHDFGIDVEFRGSTTICIERPIGTGVAVERQHEGSNPFLATVGLRIEPAPIGAGVSFQLAREVLGTMPLAFVKAVEDTVHETMQQGIHGWRVTDTSITMTDSGYSPRQSHAHQGFSKAMSSTGEDFRHLTPLVAMSALQHAGTVVCEPIHRFMLETPADALGQIVAALAPVHAVVRTQTMRGSLCVLEGEIPAARVHALQQQLPALTRGEGVLESTFDRYEPMRGAIPSRSRTDQDPRNRREYLLHVSRRL